MESECSGAQQQATHQLVSGTGATIRQQALRGKHQVGAKLLDALVAVGLQVVGLPQPFGHLRKEYSVRHVVMAGRRNRA